MEEERIEDLLKRSKQANVVRPQRIGPRSTATELRSIPPHPSLPVAYLDERLRLRTVGDNSDSMDIDEEEHDEEDTATQRGVKSLPKLVILLF